MENKLIEGLALLVLLSFVIERALAVVFDMELLRDFLKRFDFKPPVAIAASIGVCAFLKFDILRLIAATGSGLAERGLEASSLGIALTGLTVAGGSAGSVKLFQDVLGFRRTTREEQRKLASEEQAAAVKEAEARQAVAEATKQAAVLQSASPVAGLSTAEAERERVLANRYFEIASGRTN